MTASSSCTWSAISEASWITITGVAERDSGTATFTVAPNQSAGNRSGTIRIGARTVTVTQAGTASANPIGVIDTPTDNATGVTGAVPFTGWALDDVEVVSVAICRAAVPGEVAPVDPNCGGAAQIFVGFAVFIDGARTDVAALYPQYPQKTRAGWGFMVLTNMLPDVPLGRPSGGNGASSFSRGRRTGRVMRFNLGHEG